MNSVLSSTPVTFTAPMPGLEAVHDFALRSIDSAPGLFALESESAPVRLFLADAAVFVPDYSPRLPRPALTPWSCPTARRPACSWWSTTPPRAPQ